MRALRILSLDGGGVHAVSYLPVLTELERWLGKTIPESNQFDMLVGTSTGAIVATALKLGAPARKVQELYEQRSQSIFSKTIRLWRIIFYRYSSDSLRKELADFFREQTGREDDITWRELAGSEFCDLELIVTLWDVRHEKTCFLSTDSNRQGQAFELWDAPVADIITACCSGPYFFPAREFLTELPAEASAAVREEVEGEIWQGVFCDGGITGLNNPAAFGVSIAHGDAIENDTPIDVISLGSGFTTSKNCVDDIARRSALGIATNTIDALMSSSADLMDRFYATFGPSLGIRHYLRTNQPRRPDSKLDDVGAIPRLSQNFDKQNIQLHLYSTEAELNQESTASVSLLRSLWRNTFELRRADGMSEEEDSLAETPLNAAGGDSSLVAESFDSALDSSPLNRPLKSRELLPSRLRVFLTSLIVAAVPAVIALGISNAYQYMNLKTANAALTVEQDALKIANDTLGDVNVELERANQGLRKAEKTEQSLRQEAEQSANLLLKQQIQRFQALPLIVSDLLIPPLKDGTPYEDVWSSKRKNQLLVLFSALRDRDLELMASRGMSPQMQFDKALMAEAVKGPPAPLALNVSANIKEQKRMVQTAQTQLNLDARAKFLDSRAEEAADPPIESGLDQEASTQVLLDLPALIEVRALLREMAYWNASSVPPDEVREIAKKLALDSRENWVQFARGLGHADENLPDGELPSSITGQPGFQEIRLRAYRSTRQIITTLHKADSRTQLHTDRALTSAYLNFWQHYWGRLLIVEDSTVSGSMVKLGRHLRIWVEEDQKPDQFSRDANPLLTHLDSQINDLESAIQNASTAR